MALVTLKTALPQVDLETDAELIVDAGDPGAVITKVTIHVSQDAPALDVEPEPFEPQFVYTGKGGESPGLTR